MDLKQIQADKLYGTWINSLKPKTASTYRYGLIRFCEFTDKTPTTLIDEAKEDYINRVAPWEVRHVKAIDAFVASFNGDLANWTKLGMLKAIKHFYKFYKIPVFDLNKHNIPSMATEEYLDLPALKIEDIRKAVLGCGADDKLAKALILTFLSSGQGQAEIHKLHGKHLKNVVNGVAIVNMTRGKTKARYTFFIGQEALQAIKEYKPNLKDEELVFTQQSTGRTEKGLSDNYIDSMFARHADKLKLPRKYFAPHRFRHFFKTSLTGLVDATFIEYWMGHKLKGVESNYFIGTAIQERMLDAYIKNLDKLTVFTEKEVLQKQYDELKGKHDLYTQQLEKELQDTKATLNRVVQAIEVMNEMNENKIVSVGKLKLEPTDHLKHVKKVTVLEEKSS